MRENINKPFGTQLSKAIKVGLFAAGLAFSVQNASALNELAPVVTAAEATADATLTAGAATGATYVSPNGLGQALIYPYYTVRNGNKTLINVFNTDNDHAVVVKVRFREFENSRDVLDFNLVLSPNDKWSGTISETADGTGVVLTTNDRSCTAPTIYGTSAPFNSDSYTYVNPNSDLQSFQDTGRQVADRLKEGYAEIIPMGWAEPTALTAAQLADTTTNKGVYRNALHAQPDGIPANCAQIESDFIARSSYGNTKTGSLPSLGGNPMLVDTTLHGITAIPDGENPLYGNLVVVNESEGFGGGTRATALADFMDGQTLITAQAYPYFLEPTIASGAGLWSTDNLDEVEDALSAKTVINEWANNAGNGANTDWVVTFPTKSFHVDVGDHLQAGNNPWRHTLALNPGQYIAPAVAPAVSTHFTAVAPFENQFASGVSAVTIGTDFYNNEENPSTASTTGGTVSFSPGTFTASGDPGLNYEANVIRFGGDDVLNAYSQHLTFDPLNDIAGGKVSGFTKLMFTNSTDGLPVVGFMAKNRTQGSTASNYGQFIDHIFKNN